MFYLRERERERESERERARERETNVLRVPEVMSSVTSRMHLCPFTVDFQESWKRTMLGCWSPFSISTSSLNRCRSALVSLRVCTHTHTHTHTLI